MVIVITACLTGTIASAAYTVQFFHIQHRIFEDGREFNRAGFGVFEDNNYITTDKVKSVELYHPDGSEVTLTGGGFGPYKVLKGEYKADKDDPNEGQWNFASEFVTESYYSLNFDQPLQVGNYRLEVTLQGETSPNVLFKYFNGQESLPIISSDSFRGYADSSGNWIWTWDAPHDTAFWTSGLATSVRAFVTIIDKGQYVGELDIRQPTHLGIAIIPSNVVQKLEAEGDTFRVQLQLRTNDNNNRAYSNSIFTDELQKEKRKVVVIPIF
jgi:hypothetical protein